MQNYYDVPTKIIVNFADLFPHGMDKNAIIGALLIALILIGGTYFFSPKEDEKAKNGQKTTEQVIDSTRAVAANHPPVEDALDARPMVSLPGLFKSLATKVNGTSIVLENDVLKLTIQPKGAKITSVILKKYKTFKGAPVDLINEKSNIYSYKFTYEGEEIRTDALNFTLQNNSTKGLDCIADLGNGSKIVIHYDLKDGSYMVQNNLVLYGMDKIINRRFNYIDLEWKTNILRHERDFKIARDNSSIYFRPDGDKPEYLTETKTDEKDFKTKTQWVSFKEQFFVQTLIAKKTNFIRGILKSERPEESDSSKIKTLEAHLTLPFNNTRFQSYEMQMYYGPSKYKTLSSYDLNLERQIPLGWGFFLISWINRFIVIPVFNLLSSFISNYGIIILILTLFIKLLTLPFTYKSYLSTAKMKILKPELDALKLKNGNDAAKMQADQMALYRQAGVSPLGGCLPLLLQLPILLAMFRFFPSSIELRQQSFLWAKDLSTYDSIWDFGPVPDFVNSIYGDHVSLFTLLMTISTILQAHFNAQNMSGDQAQFKWMGYVMPIFFLGLFNKYAAGLSLYYLLFNIVTFAQQFIFKKLVNEDKLRAIIEQNRKKPKANKKSKWQQKLEDIQNQQKALQTGKVGPSQMPPVKGGSNYTKPKKR